MPVTAVRPVVAQYEPALQEVHTVEAVDTWKVPARQFEQLLVEGDAEYVPARQFEHTVADATE